MNHPELARQVEVPAGGRVTPDRAEVRSVLERIQEAGAGVTPAMALEIFRGLPEEEVVTMSSSGIAQELSAGEFDPWPEVSGYFRRWVQEEEDEELRQLSVLIERDQASPEARDALRSPAAVPQPPKRKPTEPQSKV